MLTGNIYVLYTRVCSTHNGKYPNLPIFSPFQPFSRLRCNFVRLKAKKSLKTKIRSIVGSIRLDGDLHQNDMILVGSDSFR